MCRGLAPSLTERQVEFHNHLDETQRPDRVMPTHTHSTVGRRHTWQESARWPQRTEGVVWCGVVWCFFGAHSLKSRPR